MIFSRNLMEMDQPMAVFLLDGHTHLMVNPVMVAAVPVSIRDGLLQELTRIEDETPPANVIDLTVVRQTKALIAGLG